jgi:hypothetical protein
MTKHQISDPLDELHNKEAYIRSDAIKKIIKGKINDERIIQAFEQCGRMPNYRASNPVRVLIGLIESLGGRFLFLER